MVPRQVLVEPPKVEASVLLGCRRRHRCGCFRFRFRIRPGQTWDDLLLLLLFHQLLLLWHFCFCQLMLRTQLILLDHGLRLRHRWLLLFGCGASWLWLKV